MTDRQPLRRIIFSQALDTVRRYLTDTPTPEAWAAAMTLVDGGDLGAMIEIAEEIEGKDAAIQGLFARRREAVTALDWSVESDPSDRNQAAATQVAEYVDARLRGIRNFSNTLKHLQTAIGPGIAVTELIWHRFELVDTNDVGGHRLQGNLYSGNTNEVFAVTEDNLVEGVRCLPPAFVVHAPHMRSGSTTRVTLLRAVGWLWVIKHHALAAWAGYCELFGHPIPEGKFKDGAPPEVITQLEDMMKHMGEDTYVLHSDILDVQLIQASGGHEPYSALMELIDRRLQILILGQTLTTEPGAVGSLALGRVHENVRASIGRSDIQQEAEMIRDQIIRPMVRMRWPGQNAPVPVFRRQLADDSNVELERLMLDKLRYMRETARSVDDAWVYEALGIPQPAREPDVAPPTTGEAITLNELTLALERAMRGADEALITQIRQKISDVLSRA